MIKLDRFCSDIVWIKFIVNRWIIGVGEFEFVIVINNNNSR